MKVNFKKIGQKLYYIIPGMTIGWGYWYFIGCEGGCTISSNPYISTLYGGIMGFLLSLDTNKE